MKRTKRVVDSERESHPAEDMVTPPLRSRYSPFLPQIEQWLAQGRTNAAICKLLPQEIKPTPAALSAYLRRLSKRKTRTHDYAISIQIGTFIKLVEALTAKGRRKAELMDELLSAQSPLPLHLIEQSKTLEESSQAQLDKVDKVKEQLAAELKAKTDKAAAKPRTISDLKFNPPSFPPPIK